MIKTKKKISMAKSKKEVIEITEEGIIIVDELVADF